MVRWCGGYWFLVEVGTHMVWFRLIEIELMNLVPMLRIQGKSCGMFLYH